VGLGIVSSKLRPWIDARLGLPIDGFRLQVAAADHFEVAEAVLLAAISRLGHHYDLGLALRPLNVADGLEICLAGILCRKFLEKI
jgi:hypothetical protein